VISNAGGEPARRAAEILARLSGELARAAAMALALPGRLPDLPGYTFAAATAIAVAEREEEDTSRWLSTVLISVTTNASILRACVTADLMAGRDEIAPPLLYQHGSNSRFAAPPFIRRIPAIVGDPGPPPRSGGAIRPTSQAHSLGLVSRAVFSDRSCGRARRAAVSAPVACAPAGP
jgi:hypothetical protein